MIDFFPELERPPDSLCLSSRAGKSMGFVAFAIAYCLVILYIVGDRAADTPISCGHCTEWTKYPLEFRQAFSQYSGVWGLNQHKI